MNLRDEEQLQRYFERKMSGTEEQNFLIDVAARDDMRLAFRSQLELLKALRADKDATMLPAVLLRGRTLATLGLGATLVPTALVGDRSAHAAPTAEPVRTGRFRSALRHPLSLLSAGLLAGATLTYSLMPSPSVTTTATSTPSSHGVVAPLIIQEPASEQASGAAPATSATVAHRSLHETTTSAPTVITHHRTDPNKVVTNVHHNEDNGTSK